MVVVNFKLWNMLLKTMVINTSKLPLTHPNTMALLSVDITMFFKLGLPFYTLLILPTISVFLPPPLTFLPPHHLHPYLFKPTLWSPVPATTFSNPNSSTLPPSILLPIVYFKLLRILSSNMKWKMNLMLFLKMGHGILCLLIPRKTLLVANRYFTLKGIRMAI